MERNIWYLLLVDFFHRLYFNDTKNRLNATYILSGFIGLRFLCAGPLFCLSTKGCLVLIWAGALFQIGETVLQGRQGDFHILMYFIGREGADSDHVAVADGVP